VNRGGTGQDFADLAIGDLLYGDVEADGVTPKFSLLADVAVGSYLRSGGLLTAPLWSTLKLPNTAAVGDILIASTLDTITGLAIGASGTIIRSNGTIPANSGFTIPNTFATGNLVYASATNVLSGLAVGATGNFLRWSGTVPTWSTLTIVNQGATGGILHTSTTDNATFLAIGTVGKILRSTGTLPAWTTLTVPNTATTGGILHASATDVTTFLAIGAAGKLIRSTGTLPAYSTFTIPDTFALGDVVYGSATNVLTALAGNITTTQKFLSQTGTGTVSAAPSWQLVPAVGSLVFFFKKTASSIATYFEMSTPASVAAAQTIVSGTLTTGTTTLANFATVAGVPNVTFVPGGVCTCYITSKVDAVAGSKTVQLVAEFYQRTTGGTETLRATSAQTINLTTLDAAYIFQGAIPSSLVFVASDRLVTRVRAVVAGAGSDVVVTLTIEGTTAARSESPSATVDATNFLPYVGATANVDTGTFTITTPKVIGGTAVGSSLVLQSTSAAGTTDFIRFLVGNNGATEAMRIINSGFIGLGTDTPLFDLHLVKAAAAVIQIDVSGTGNTAFSVVRNSTDNTFFQFAARGSTIAGSTFGILRAGMVECIFAPTATGVGLLGTNTTAPLVLATNSLERIRILSTGQVGIGTLVPSQLLTLGSTGALAWDNAGTADVMLFRDAANTLAQRNGTAGQLLNIYDTYTSATNFESLAIGVNTVDVGANTFSILTRQGSGGGSAQTLNLGTTGNVNLSFITNGGFRWHMTGSGHFIANADNIFDIGATGATRPRTGYFGTSVVAPTFIGSGTALTGFSLFDHFVDSSVGGAEADIYSDTLAANAFNANGAKIIAEYGGNFITVGTELTQLKVYLAGTAIWDSTGVAPTTGTTSWRVYVELIRVSSSVVRYTVSLNTTGASGYVYAGAGELTGLTLSGTNILKITGTSTGVGSGAGDIVGKMGYVKFAPAA
jgi:hypothetical protein